MSVSEQTTSFESYLSRKTSMKVIEGSLLVGVVLPEPSWLKSKPEIIVGNTDKNIKIIK